MLAHEGVHRHLLALHGAVADPLRHHVEHDHLRAEALGEVAADSHRELGVGAAAHRHEDRLHLVEAALLHDRDVARALAHDGVDGRREDRARADALAGEGQLRGLRLRAGGLRRGRRAAPSEDDEVRTLLADGLDHAVGRVSADADHRPQLHALLVADVEHALEQAARGAGLRGALGQADALGNLDDAEHGDLGRAPVGDSGADADEVARRPRVGERQEDAVRRAAARRHQAGSLAARISRQRVTRYGFSSSNWRAWSSITRSAWSVVMSSVSLMKPAVRPK